MCKSHHGMQIGNSTHRTDAQRQFNPKMKLIAHNRPMGQTGIFPIFRCIRVCTCLRRPKIIPRSNNYGVDPIHDPLIMRHRPIGFHRCDAYSSAKLFRKLEIPNATTLLNL